MNDALSIAQDLLRCPSVTPADAGALAVLETRLKDAGFEVHRVTFSEPGTADIDNLYARIGTTAPHITFAGHTDVVPPGDEAAWTHGAFSGDIKDGFLYGRGAVDMKGGIACSVAAVRRRPCMSSIRATAMTPSSRKTCRLARCCMKS
jgi:succinyl-diaminopimelate desuccinylase